MKSIIFALLFSTISCLSCALKSNKYTPICVTGQEYKGEGLKSELIIIKTTGKTETSLSFLNTNVSYLNVINSKLNKEKGSGITVRISKSGSKKFEIGGIANSIGNYATLLEKGKYDIEFLFTGCNPLLLRNFEIKSGDIKHIEVVLGLQGKEVKKHEIILK
jgi:hypothetical protein